MEGERGILERRYGDALQGERQMCQALAEEKEGIRTVSQGDPGLTHATSSISLSWQKKHEIVCLLLF